MILFSFILVIVAILLPSDSWAWGPITHIDYAHQALQHVSTYGPVVKALLTEFPHDFLYGSLAADITLGKDYVDYVHNCHNWRVGFLIFNEAKEDRQKAAALGYLSHLSVDIISHNFFVPYKTIRSYPTRVMGHVYWEMRFDSQSPEEYWELARGVSKKTFPHNDELFERMLRKTIFSFKTNKKIFKSVLTLHRIKHWKSMMSALHGVSRFKLHEQDREDYRQMAIHSAVNFLKHLDKAPCVHVDPTGADKLLYADSMRKELKNLTRKKILSEEKAYKFLKVVRAALKDNIYHPKHPLPIVTDFL